MFVLAFVKLYVKPIVNVALTLKSSLSHTITEVDVAAGGSGSLQPILLLEGSIILHSWFPMFLQLCNPGFHC